MSQRTPEQTAQTMMRTFDGGGGVTPAFAEYLMQVYHFLVEQWENDHPGKEADPTWMEAYYAAMVACMATVLDTALHAWRDLVEKGGMQA